MNMIEADKLLPVDKIYAEFIGWNLGAASIKESVDHALSTASSEHVNFPKFSLENTFLYVFDCEILSTLSSQAPGTIVEITSNSLVISTNTNDIALLKLGSSNFYQNDYKKLFQQLNVSIGFHLITLEYDQVELYRSSLKKLSNYTDFWLRVLNDVEPLNYLKVFERVICKDERLEKLEPIAVMNLADVEYAALAQLTDMLAHENRSLILLSIILIYLYRINNYENFTLWLQSTSTLNDQFPASLFSDYLPLNISDWTDLNFSDCFKSMMVKVSDLEKNETFSNDLLFSNEILRKKDFYKYIAIDFVDSLEHYRSNEKIFCHIVIERHGLKAGIYISPHLIEQEFEDSVQYWPSHIQTLVESIIEQEQWPIHEHAILPTAHLNTLLVDWNNTATDYPKDKLIHELFDEQAALHPNKVAITFENSQITYWELKEKSDQFADFIYSCGPLENKIVMIIGDRSIDFIIALLGVLKSGSIYAPVDLSYPIKAIQELINLAAPALIFSTETIIDQLKIELHSAYLDRQLFNLEETLLFKEELIEKRVEPCLTSADPAYIIFTSGSTGKPKACVLPHKAAIRLVCNTNFINFYPNDVVAHISNLSFDASILEVWGALLNGSALVIFNKKTVIDFISFSNLLVKEKITVIFLTTAF